MVKITTYVSLPPVVRGQLRVAVVLAAPVDAEKVEGLVAVVEAFLRTLNRGAFVDPRSPPSAAQAKVVGSQPLGSGQDWTCDVRALDHRFAQVFRNAIVMFNQVFHPVHSIRIVASPTPNNPVPPLQTLGSAPLPSVYPPLSNVLGFTHRVEASLDPKGARIVDISFAKPLSDDNLETIVGWLEDWEETVRGGYSDDEEGLETGDCAIFDAMPDIDDDFTIRMPILRVGAPDIAWNSLLNLCGRIHSDLASIARVEIRS